MAPQLSGWGHPSPVADDGVVIESSADVSPEALDKLRTAAARARAYFIEEFGPVEQPLRFVVGSASDALRAGYNFESKTIALPNLSGVRESGLHCLDVVHHEAFHALMHLAYPESYAPELMEGRKAESLHEGLADLFAHRLEPDAHFGEGYYESGAPIRAYQSDLSFHLSTGGHAQGNALTSMLLEHQISDRQLRDFLERGDFRVEALAEVSPEFSQAMAHDASLQVTTSVANYPQSNKDRYWLRDELPLEVSLQPNAAAQQSFQQFRVEWTNKQGESPERFAIEQGRSHSFTVTPKSADVSPEKVIARFYDGDRLVGFRPFYFGARD